MQAGILDLLLNQIIEHTVHQFAVRAVESIDRWVSDAIGFRQFA